MLSDDMKYRWILTLLFCGLLFPALRAEDEVAQKVPNDQTAQIPKDSGLLVRFPSLDRLDELAKRFKGVAELAGGPQVAVAAWRARAGPGAAHAPGGLQR